MNQIGFEKTSLTLERSNVPNDMEQLIEYEQFIKNHPKNIAFHLNKNPDTRNAISCITWKRVDYKKEWFKLETNPTTLSEEPNTRKLQTFLYENLLIDVNTDNNNPLKKFAKWVIDWLIIWNTELVMKIIEVWPKNFLETLANEFLSLDWLKKIAEWLWKTLVEILSLDSYKTWKSVSELWLITTWAWAIWWWVKKVWKLSIKQAWKIWTETTLRNLTSKSFNFTWKTLNTTWTVLQTPTVLTWKWVNVAKQWINNLSKYSWLTSAIDTTKEVIKDTLKTSETIKNVKQKVDTVLWKTKELEETTSSIETKSPISEVQDNVISNVAEILWPSIEELEKAWLPRDYIKSLQEIGLNNSDIIRLKWWWEKTLHREECIRSFLEEFNRNAVEKWTPLMTLEEAHSIYWYTTNLFYRQLNNTLWDWKWDSLQLTSLLNSWVSKMPKIHETQFRWDNYILDSIFKKYWLPEGIANTNNIPVEMLDNLVWETIPLKWFMSSSSHITEPFWSNSRYQIEIINSSTHDITWLSLFPNFWHELKSWTKTNQESLLKPWSDLIIQTVKQTIWTDWKPIIKIRSKLINN